MAGPFAWTFCLLLLSNSATNYSKVRGNTWLKMPDFDKLAFPDSGSAQVIETAVRDCAVESVVVYADRAEVKRRVPVSLAAGKNEVVVHGLSTCIDKNSIRSAWANSS